MEAVANVLMGIGMLVLMGGLVWFIVTLFKRRGRKIPAIVMGVAFAVVVAGAAVSPSSREPAATSGLIPTPALTANAKPTPTTIPTPTPERIFQVSIREMMDLYESNQVAADAEYKGKQIATRGLVDAIEEGKFRLLPLDSDQFQVSGAECNLVKDQHDLIIGLRKGDVVSVVGSHSGFAGVLVKTAKIRDCRIVEE